MTAATSGERCCSDSANDTALVVVFQRAPSYMAFAVAETELNCLKRAA